MLKFKKELKFNKGFEYIIKSFFIFFFTLVIFDKSSLNHIKDLIIKLDAEQVVSNFTQLMLAFKTLTFDLPILFSFFIVVFNIICVTSLFILMILFICKMISKYFISLNECNISYTNHSLDRMVSNIYLINEKFRC